MEWLLVLVAQHCGGYTPGWSARSFTMPDRATCVAEAERLDGAICVPRQPVAVECDPTVIRSADLDGDGVVTGDDLVLFQRAFEAQP